MTKEENFESNGFQANQKKEKANYRLFVKHNKVTRVESNTQNIETKNWYRSPSNLVKSDVNAASEITRNNRIAEYSLVSFMV